MPVTVKGPSFAKVIEWVIKLAVGYAILGWRGAALMALTGFELN